jgi:hypothetical protein
MDTSVTERTRLPISVKIVLLLLVVAVAALLVLYLSLRDSLNQQKSSVNSLGISMGKNYADISNATSFANTTVDPVNFLVYLPEFRVKLPYNDISKTLAYRLRNFDKNGQTVQSDYRQGVEADVTSRIFAQTSAVTVMDCSDLARIKVETKQNPYSPHERAISVKLQDGRTLQIYQVVGSKECQQAWNNSISPGQVTAELEKAQSY